MRLGEWVSTAPIGYLHEKDQEAKRDRSKIIVDLDCVPLIRKIFETYATGSYTLLSILQKTKEWDLRNSRGNEGYLCCSHIYKIIQNLFYYGIMRYGIMRILKTGKEYPHIYQPLISKELFDACQRVRLNLNRKPFKHGGKEYIFRELIKCAVTGRIVTAKTKKKVYVNGKTTEWIYLRVWRQDNPNKRVYVQEETVLKEVEKVLATLHLDPELAI